MGGFSDIFPFPEGIFKKEPDQRMKFKRTNKVGKFEVKKVKNKGAVSKNVVRVAISPRSPEVKSFPAIPRPVNGDLKGANLKKWSVLLVCTIHRRFSAQKESEQFRKGHKFSLSDFGFVQCKTVRFVSA